MASMAPMLATPGPPPSGSGWSWEMKWDGTPRVHLLSHRIGDELACL